MSDRPIFIVGCPGSGTTVLQLMLDAHPRIAMAPETRVLVQAHRNRRAFGDMRKPVNRRRLAEWVVGMPRTQFDDLGIDAAAFVARAVAGPGSLGSVVGLVYQMFAERYGKPRWGDRRSTYIRHFDVLLALFPDAQIVHVLRDGRDCVASLKQMPWFQGDVFEAVNRWAETVDLGRRAKRKLPAGSYHELRYEDLTGDPENTLTGLCEFIGESYHPVMRQPYLTGDAVSQHQDLPAGTEEVTTSQIGDWSRRLAPWEIALCESALGGRLRRHGYELSGGPKARREHMAAYERTAAFWRGKWRRQTMVDRLNRLREPGPVAAVTRPGAAPAAGIPQQSSGPDARQSTSNRVDAR